jgi:hypothetical protein
MGYSHVLAANASCPIHVAFPPSETETRSSALPIADNASDSPQTVPLTGTPKGIPDPLVDSSIQAEGGGLDEATSDSLSTLDSRAARGLSALPHG